VTAGPATTVNDRYPTRTGERCVVVPRHDPVVRGGLDDGPLDAADLAGFDSNGFIARDAVLTPDEVIDLRTELEALRASTAVLDDERAVLEPESNELRSIFEIHQVSDPFADLVADPRLVEPACQLLGSDVYVHQSRVNLKRGYHGQGFYWHSDFETWHAEDGMPGPRAVSVSLALTANLDCNGSLLIIPGSHRTFVACPGETPPDHYKQSLRRQEVGTPDERSLAQLTDAGGIAQFVGQAGSAVFFDSNCMHGSNSNITPYPRSNVFIVYNSVDNALVEPFRAVTPRPTFIANRDFTPVPHAAI
jgi:ectoine hydroxylase